MSKKLLALVSVSLLALAACSQNTASVTPTDSESSEYTSSAMMDDTSSDDTSAAMSDSSDAVVPAEPSSDAMAQ